MYKYLTTTKLLACWASIVLLSACASTPDATQSNSQAEVVETNEGSQGAADIGEQADVVVEANPDQLKIASDRELAADPDLPLQDLDSETLERLLLMNFASYQGAWQVATSNALKAAELSKDFRVARMATLIALRDEDYKSAALGAAAWTRLKPNSVNAQNMHILSLVGSAQLDAAKQAITAQQADQDIDSYIKQVVALLVRQKNPEGGFEIADYLVQQNPQSAQVHVSAAYVAETFKKYEAAQVWVDKALELRPGWDLAAQMNANILRTQNKLDERAAFIDQFVKDYPGSIAMRINHSAELSRAKDYQGAYSVMQGVLKDAPKNVDALQYTAALAEQLEDNKKSAYYYRRALSLEPKNDDIRWSLARLAVAEKKYATAERLFNDISDERMLIRAQIQVANMRNETQGVTMAVNTLRAIEPKTEDEYVQVAITRHYLLMEAKQLEEAFGYVNETLVYLPDNLELLYARALVASELKRLDIAEQDFAQIIAAQPDHANALNAYGYTLADQTDRYDEAKELIAKALELRPNDAHILDSMGWVLYRLNDLEGAIEYLQKAYDVSPETEIAAHLGEVLWESGQPDKARALWSKTLSEDDENSVLNETLKRYEVDLSSAAPNLKPELVRADRS